MPAETSPSAKKADDKAKKSTAPKSGDKAKKPTAPKSGDKAKKPIAPKSGDKAKKPVSTKSGDKAKKPVSTKSGAKGKQPIKSKAVKGKGTKSNKKALPPKIINKKHLHADSKKNIALRKKTSEIKAKKLEKRKEKASKNGPRKQRVNKVTHDGRVIKAKNLKPGAVRFGQLKRRIIRKLVKPYVKKHGLKTKKTPLYVTKPIGGEKNGSTRTVLVKKPPSYYPAEVKKKRKGAKKLPVRAYLKKSLTPGVLCIVVAGPHKGKRVVFLKQLESGLCLITGPYVLNKCPLRRINQIYLIATATTIPLEAKFSVPEHINDKYFRRIKLNNKKAKKDGEDIFNTKPKKYTCSIRRKSDQKSVDTLILRAVRKHTDRTSLLAYMGTKFGLRNKQYPHLMKF